jgi:hypothetical protein
VAVALTASSVYLFGYKPEGFSIKVKGQPTVWERRAVTITPTGVGPCDGVSVSLHDSGETLQLENTALVGLGGFNAAFYDLLNGTA